MSKTLTLLAVIIGAGIAGFTNPSAVQDEAQVAIEALKKERVQLLQDRVEGIKKMIALGIAPQSELLRPEIDVINAQLEYTESNASREKLVGELLGKYDAMIELAQERANNPPPPNAAKAENYGMRMQSELLHLKSERIRIQIVHDTAK